MSNIISIIFIIASLLLTFIYVSPTYNGITGSSEITKKSVKELKAEKERYVAALQKVREIEEVRNGLLTKYNAIQGSDREKLIKMVPENIDSVRLIIDINNIASAYNFTLKDISINQAPTTPVRRDSSEVVPTTQKNYSYVTLSFNVTGAYNNLMAFMSDLERSLRIIDIEALKIDIIENQSAPTKGKTQGELNYKMSVTMKTYFMASN